MKEWQASYNEIMETMRTKDIIKVGTMEFTRGEAERIYQFGYFIINWRGVWQLDYSAAQKTFAGRLIIRYSGLIQRGRHQAMPAADINDLLGYNAVIDITT